MPRFPSTNYDFPNRLATGLDKIVIESELNVKPDPNESYCFYSMGNYTKDENENISLKNILNSI
jgi:hypothetical protein